MKVGTDGVLLGAWCDSPTVNSQPSTVNCLDIGTGTGLIALMLAQRFPHAKIIGIDIDDASYVEDAIKAAKERTLKAVLSRLKSRFSSMTSKTSTPSLINTM